MIINPRISTSLGPANSQIEVPEQPAHVFEFAMNLVANGQAFIVPEPGSGPVVPETMMAIKEAVPDPEPDPEPEPTEGSKPSRSTKKKRG